MTNTPDAQPARTLGSGGPVVSRLALGTSSWSTERFGTGPIDAFETVLDMADASAPDFTLIDTSNEYGAQASERFIGDALRRRGGLPQSMVVQTKLDRDPETGSFASARMWRSLMESSARLGLESIPMMYLHDPEHISWDEAFAVDGPVQALVEMKEKGLVERIGISGGPAPMLQRYVETGRFDAVITHNRFTLVDRSAEELINVAVDRDVTVINAAVYGGGALAKWPTPPAKYAYSPIKPETAAAITAMGELCAAAGISLADAALQFSTRDSRITSTVVGVTSAEQVLKAAASDRVAIPESLWAQLDELVPPAATWVNPPGSTWP
ncbi:MAG TPA: aldo/keto reductase [Glaciihabitans sp.]|jgi:D-threo-aldose 1-dehydrogenase|nr:aldo/keto reductase [Glaciihabitans sp.]